MLGSVSHRVLAHAPCAVLTVPLPLRELRKVLLAVKGHEDASTAMRFLLQKPFKEPVDIDVLTVLPFTHERAADATESERLKEMALRSAHRFVEDIAAVYPSLKAMRYRERRLELQRTPFFTMPRSISLI